MDRQRGSEERESLFFPPSNASKGELFIPNFLHALLFPVFFLSMEQGMERESRYVCVCCMRMNGRGKKRLDGELGSLCTILLVVHFDAWFFFFKFCVTCLLIARRDFDVL